MTSARRGDWGPTPGPRWECSVTANSVVVLIIHSGKLVLSEFSFYFFQPCIFTWDFFFKLYSGQANHRRLAFKRVLYLGSLNFTLVLPKHRKLSETGPGHDLNLQLVWSLRCLAQPQRTGLDRLLSGNLETQTSIYQETHVIFFTGFRNVFGIVVNKCKVVATYEN